MYIINLDFQKIIRKKVSLHFVVLLTNTFHSIFQKSNFNHLDRKLVSKYSNVLCRPLRLSSIEMESIQSRWLFLEMGYLIHSDRQ